MNSTLVCIIYLKGNALSLGLLLAKIWIEKEFSPRRVLRLFWERREVREKKFLVNQGEQGLNGLKIVEQILNILAILHVTSQPENKIPMTRDNNNRIHMRFH